MRLKPEERRMFEIAANVIGLVILFLYMFPNIFGWSAIAILVYCSAKRRRAAKMDFEENKYHS